METGRLKQIEEIYHAALEIPSAKRESFFREHCGADENLRREVESLLAFEESSDNFLDRPPESLAAEMFVEQEEQANLTGREIGHYKVKKLLGKGGMGEVYLAEDARLKRRVALKILPPEFAADASRRNRFEQEARAASALNHPNILTVHEFGAENGIHFLATEYIEGETLRERIGGGELSLADALDIAAQTAFALSAAHAAGVVHRDIKPENIMIRADGIVKVLDFGIAKLIASPLNAEGETLEKISTRTKPGALLGTLAYMSPEQIRGETLDARSDVFSLGVCLYEMLTGENLKENPSPVTQENSAFPAELERILSKTLKKKRDERYQTSRDFLLDVKSLRREIEFSESAERTGSKKSLTTNAEATVYTTNVDSGGGGFSFPKWLPVFLVAGLLVGGAASQITSGADEIRNVVWHADGKRVFYSQNTNGTFQIFAADAIGGGNTAQVTVVERDAFALDVSADGAKILYGSSKEESDLWGAKVEKGEEFSFASDIDSELWADVSPDGKTVAYQSIKNLSQGDKLFIGAILTKPTDSDAPPFQLTASGGLPVWSPDGKRLAFIRVSGETHNLWIINNGGSEEKQLTTDGLSLVEYTILPYNRYQARSFSWSPDSLKIAFISSHNESNNIWIVDANGSNSTQLTDNTDSNLSLYCPLLTTDGKRVAYSSKTNKSLADGKKFYSVSVVDTQTKNSKLVVQSETYQRLLGWSRSDKELIFASISGKDGKGSPMEVSIVQINVENGERRQLAKLESAYLYNICLSADKKMLAYVSNRDGKDNIRLMGMAAGEATRKITSNNDARLYFSTLAWSPDSRTIYFGKQTRYSLLSMVTNFK